MAFFKFRRSREEQAAKLAPAQTVEALRRRAMHRLIGAAVLVLAGVIGFPLVFDNQPRPIPVDLPIEIADKTKVKSLVVPPATSAAAASGVVVAPAAGPEAPITVVLATPAAPTATPEPAAPAAPKPAVPAAEKPGADKPAAEKPADKAATKTADANKAQALLEGKDVADAATAGDSRFVVQVGAFTDANKVREVRQKVERAGLKTYTQVVDTKEGSRTRIRVGPFADKAQATQVAEKLRKLELTAVILTL